MTVDPASPRELRLTAHAAVRPLVPRGQLAEMPVFERGLIPGQ